MFTTDLIEQYSKINVQQHFGQVNITEAWYLENIKQFILDAKWSLPSELGKIILHQDFVGDRNNIWDRCFKVAAQSIKFVS